MSSVSIKDLFASAGKRDPADLLSSLRKPEEPAQGSQPLDPKALLAKLKRERQQSPPQEPVEQIAEPVKTESHHEQLVLNSITPVDNTRKNISFQVSSSEDPLPVCFSEASTVSILAGKLPSLSSGRLVAAGGQYLCLARGESLWILDMTTGLSNDRSVGYSNGPITDMELGSNFLLFTDGTDVGVIKCLNTASDGSSVPQIGSVYLPKLGTESDPVLSVHWHPTSPAFFVTVRAQAGWTLWDMSRLVTKNTAVNTVTDLLDTDIEGSIIVPSLFKAHVDSPQTVSEGTFAWSSASNVIAGKKLSPGVLAILKRGDVSPERKTLSTASKFERFGFSANGAIAIGCLSDSAIRVWKIGHRCATVSSVNCSSLQLDTPIVDIVSVSGSRFCLVSASTISFIEVSEEGRIELLRTIKFANLVLRCIAHSAGDTLLVGGHMNNQGVMVMVNERTVGVSPCPQESVRNISAAQTMGNASQTAVYAVGETGNNTGLMWTAQTLDSTLFSDQTIESGDMSPVVLDQRSPINEDEDFPHSDASMGAPERLESDVGLVRSQSINGDLKTALKRMEEGFVKELVGDVNKQIAHALKERTNKQQRELQSAADKEARRIETAIEKVLKEQFASGLKRAMDEIATQIERRIAARLDGLVETIMKKREQNLVLERRIDELVARTEQAISRLATKGDSMSSRQIESPALAEIRRFINAGDHLQAISSATQWWKLNQPIPAGQSDLLAIACAAIAPQIRPGESIRDIPSGCYMLLVLTEWTKVNAGSHADRSVAVLRATKYVLSCLFASPINVVGETLDLCYKSLSKSVRNTAGVLGSYGDRTVDELSRQVLTDIRELMIRFTTSSRASTPRGSVSSPGTNILQMLQGGRRS